MAEVATGVLHNVGNVLNSVNVSASLVVEKLRRSKAPKLAKAAALLTQHNGNVGDFLTNDPNGQKLPGYLAKLGEFFVAENAELLEEVDQLGRNIEHIKEVVAMQQSYAKVSGVFENLPAHRLVEDAIAMNIGAFQRHGVSVDRQFSPVPLVRVDRHKVLQILINLLRNAKYALDESKRTDKRIILSIFAINERNVHIVVADNGIGISEENLTRIFAHGFTTREEGHGFGLHSGALAARAMGGSLSVASGGTGHGATFTLELPIASITSNT
jgi:two-component system NtrC family sensor kinase